MRDFIIVHVAMIVILWLFIAIATSLVRPDGQGLSDKEALISLIKGPLNFF